jgi:serine/threonine protein kinase
VQSPQTDPKVPEYECLRQIGGGAYGDVWLARSQTGSLKALKIVRRDRFRDDRPFNREYEAIQKYEDVSRGHSSLIEILHVGRPDDTFFYYVMPLADDLTGRRPEAVDSYKPLTLSALLETDPLPAQRGVSVVIELLQGLRVLHRAGLVHRDIKPSNIVFIGGRPALADIGLVTDVRPDVSNLGTSGFMAPEGAGKSADLYAIGMTLYTAVSGLPPSGQLPAPTLASEAEQAFYAKLNEIIVKVCSDRPSRRYASAATFQRALQGLDKPQPSQKTRTKPRAKKSKPAIRTKREFVKEARAVINKTVAELRKDYPHNQQFLTIAELRQVTAAVRLFFSRQLGRTPMEITISCQLAESVLEPNKQKRSDLIKSVLGEGLLDEEKYATGLTVVDGPTIVTPFKLISDGIRVLSSVTRLTYFNSKFGRLQQDQDAATRQALSYLQEHVERSIDENWYLYKSEIRSRRAG